MHFQAVLLCEKLKSLGFLEKSEPYLLYRVSCSPNIISTINNNNYLLNLTAGGGELLYSHFPGAG
jgi:hypothetical protein